MSKERRSWPRLVAEFPFTVQIPARDKDARTFDGTAMNISRSSVEFSCATELVTALLQQKIFPYTCEVAFRLPWSADEFSMTAQVLSHRRVSQHQYVLVLLLLHADNAQELRLVQALEARQSNPPVC